MKPGGYFWLSAANTRRGRRNTGIFVLMTIGLTSLILVIGMAQMLNAFMDRATNNDYARRILFGPMELENQPLTDPQKKKIEQMNGVLSLEENNRWVSKYCELISYKTDNGEIQKFPEIIHEPGAGVISAYKTETIQSLYGKQLSDSQTYACLVPNYFYPDFDTDILNEDVDFLDGRNFIGTTLYFKSTKSLVPMGQYSSVDIPLIEFQLEVIGVYDIKNTAFTPGDILVSYNTGIELDKLCMDALKQKNPVGYEAVQEKRQQDNYKFYSVLVDDYKNVQNVITQLEEIGISNCTPSVIIMDSFKLLTSVVNIAGRAFTFAVLGLAVLNIFLAVHNAMTERTKEIGLLKAIGYKDRQVFLSMYLEQLKIGMKSFCIAAVLSAAAFALYNWFAQNGSYDSMLKTVSWTSAALLAAAALAIAVLVPLLCQLFTLRRLVKIPPSEAMKL